MFIKAREKNIALIRVRSLKSQRTRHVQYSTCNQLIENHRRHYEAAKRDICLWEKKKKKKRKEQGGWVCSVHIKIFCRGIISHSARLITINNLPAYCPRQSNANRISRRNKRWEIGCATPAAPKKADRTKWEQLALKRETTRTRGWLCQMGRAFKRGWVVV